MSTGQPEARVQAVHLGAQASGRAPKLVSQGDLWFQQLQLYWSPANCFVFRKASTLHVRIPIRFNTRRRGPVDGSPRRPGASLGARWAFSAEMDARQACRRSKLAVGVNLSGTAMRPLGKLKGGCFRHVLKASYGLEPRGHESLKDVLDTSNILKPRSLRRFPGSSTAAKGLKFCRAEPWNRR